MYLGQFIRQDGVWITINIISYVEGENDNSSYENNKKIIGKNVSLKVNEDNIKTLKINDYIFFTTKQIQTETNDIPAATGEILHDYIACVLIDKDIAMEKHDDGYFFKTIEDNSPFYVKIDNDVIAGPITQKLINKRYRLESYPDAGNSVKIWNSKQLNIINTTKGNIVIINTKSLKSITRFPKRFFY